MSIVSSEMGEQSDPKRWTERKKTAVAPKETKSKFGTGLKGEEVRQEMTFALGTQKESLDEARSLISTSGLFLLGYKAEATFSLHSVTDSQIQIHKARLFRKVVS